LRSVGSRLLDAMTEQPTTCIHVLAKDRNEKLAFGRFLDHSAVSHAEMLTTAGRYTGQRAAGRHVLAIQDTTEFNFPSHAVSKCGFGRSGNDRDRGLFLHPTIAVDASHGGMIGLVAPAALGRRHRAAVLHRAEPAVLPHCHLFPVDETYPGAAAASRVLAEHRAVLAEGGTQVWSRHPMGSAAASCLPSRSCCYAPPCRRFRCGSPGRSRRCRVAGGCRGYIRSQVVLDDPVRLDVLRAKRQDRLTRNGSRMGLLPIPPSTPSGYFERRRRGGGGPRLRVRGRSGGHAWHLTRGVRVRHRQLDSGTEPSPQRCSPEARPPCSHRRDARSSDLAWPLRAGRRGVGSPAGLAGAKGTRHSLTKFGKGSRRICVPEELVRVAVDQRPFVSNELPKAGRKDRVIKLALKDIVPRRTACPNTHSPTSPMLSVAVFDGAHVPDSGASSHRRDANYPTGAARSRTFVAVTAWNFPAAIRAAQSRSGDGAEPGHMRRPNGLFVIAACGR